MTKATRKPGLAALRRQAHVLDQRIEVHQQRASLLGQQLLDRLRRWQAWWIPASGLLTGVLLARWRLRTLLAGGWRFSGTLSATARWIRRQLL